MEGILMVPDIGLDLMGLVFINVRCKNKQPCIVRHYPPAMFCVLYGQLSHDWLFLTIPHTPIHIQWLFPKRVVLSVSSVNFKPTQKSMIFYFWLGLNFNIFWQKIQQALTFGLAWLKFCQTKFIVSGSLIFCKTKPWVEIPFAWFDRAFKRSQKSVRAKSTSK